ncbi:hypothetical protein [Micromonospora inositola]|uniref:Uncharacterized protein n=1 Tax=Micromonospora inositola TaxID=47865 RepID=A0A1C5JQ56_9ACTN|nr:hypothetical protein [Micromonospora inositola]SCG72710.1 hypothetical protein GA0070613_5141 [Micromonospora inositola]
MDALIEDGLLPNLEIANTKNFLRSLHFRRSRTGPLGRRSAQPRPG